MQLPGARGSYRQRTALARVKTIFRVRRIRTRLYESALDRGLLAARAPVRHARRLEHIAQVLATHGASCSPPRDWRSDAPRSSQRAARTPLLWHAERPACSDARG